MTIGIPHSPKTRRASVQSTKVEIGDAQRMQEAESKAFLADNYSADGQHGGLESITGMAKMALSGAAAAFTLMIGLGTKANAAPIDPLSDGLEPVAIIPVSQAACAVAQVFGSKCISVKDVGVGKLKKKLARRAVKRVVQKRSKAQIKARNKAAKKRGLKKDQSRVKAAKRNNAKRRAAAAQRRAEQRRAAQESARAGHDGRSVKNTAKNIRGANVVKKTRRKKAISQLKHKPRPQVAKNKRTTKRTEVRKADEQSRKLQKGETRTIAKHGRRVKPHTHSTTSKKGHRGAANVHFEPAKHE